MANTMQYETMLKNMIPIVAESFPVLQAAYAEKENFNVPAGKGSPIIINRPNPNNFTVAAITPAAYGSGEASITSDPETLTLGQPVGVNFAPTDREVAQAAWEGIMSPTIMLGAQAIGKYVASALADVAIVSSFRQVTKTADAIYDLAALRDQMALNGINPNTATLALPSLLSFESNANVLSSQILNAGVGGYDLNTKLGRIAYDHSLLGKTFTDGTSDSLYQVKTGWAKGAFSGTLDTEGTGTMVKGDMFTIAGVTGQYVVTGTGITAHSQVLSFWPSLAGAAADNAVITLVDTTAASLGLLIAPMGLAFASRPLSVSAEAKGQTFFASASDEASGISLNYEVRREFYQERRQLSIMFAVAKGYPDAIVKYKIS